MNCLVFSSLHLMNIGHNWPNCANSKMFFTPHNWVIFIFTWTLYCIEVPTAQCAETSGYIHQFIVVFIITNMNISSDQNWINLPISIFLRYIIIIITTVVIRKFVGYPISKFVVVFLYCLSHCLYYLYTHVFFII